MVLLSDKQQPQEDSSAPQEDNSMVDEGNKTMTHFQVSRPMFT